MKTRVTARTTPFPLFGGMWLPLFLLAVFLSGAGCAKVKELVEWDAPKPEIAVQSVEYGVVTQVTTARMKAREIRLGDIAITVDTDGGRVLVVIQPEDDIYQVGDRVRIIRNEDGFVSVQLI